MKRNMELIREILFYIETTYEAGTMQIRIKLKKFSDAEVFEHCILLYQANLIQSFEDLSTDEEIDCFVGNLTNEGYDYLDKIRDASIWKKTKDIITKERLPFIISTVKDISIALINAAVGKVITNIVK